MNEKELRANYRREFRNSGEDIETVSYYEVSKNLLVNPPENKKIIDEVIKILKGTGIARITITFLDKNTNPKPK